MTAPASNSGTFQQYAATVESHAADKGHDNPPRLSLDTGLTCRCTIP